MLELFAELLGFSLEDISNAEILREIVWIVLEEHVPHVGIIRGIVGILIGGHFYR